MDENGGLYKCCLRASIEALYWGTDSRAVLTPSVEELQIVSSQQKLHTKKGRSSGLERATYIS